MHATRQGGDYEGLASLDDAEIKVLGGDEERALLRALDACKRKLASALTRLKSAEADRGGDEPQTLARYIASYHAGDGPTGATLGAVSRRYAEVRGKLALANMKLVAHVAKKFRDRGVAHSDLIQEGFCGLLEAIDRFDLKHETKLATYATWWIRQSMQRAVASGAYPVRLSPRHLRQLAQSQEGNESEGRAVEPPTEMIHRIQTATRPTVSLDASYDSESDFRLIHSMSDPEGNVTDEVDSQEAVVKLLEGLRPREQEVLALRFGLSGKSKHSLSQVGSVLGVSKERVRQIQDRALEKLRDAARGQGVEDLLVNGA